MSGQGLKKNKKTFKIQKQDLTEMGNEWARLKISGNPIETGDCFVPIKYFCLPTYFIGLN